MTSISHLVCLSCFLIAVILNFLFPSHAANCNSCCSNTTYKEINEPHRSIKSVWQQGQPALCDRGLQSGWYRFTSGVGGMMPERTVLEYHCGTHDPIWLNGSHPTVTEGNVVRQVCINSFGVDCDDSFDINVKNCGDYYVYYLRRTRYCAVAYCAGKKYIMFKNVCCRRQFPIYLLCFLFIYLFIYLFFVNSLLEGRLLWRAARKIGSRCVALALFVCIVVLDLFSFISVRLFFFFDVFYSYFWDMHALSTPPHPPTQTQ